MNAELLHDAISLLPEDLLTDVDRLRQKKRSRWKELTALAACLCLVAGLLMFFPTGATTADSASGTAENGEAESPQYSVTTSTIDATVAEVCDEYVLVKIQQPENSESLTTETSVKLSFEHLAKIPDLQVGQRIQIFYAPAQYDQNKMTICPHKIEIIQE